MSLLLKLVARNSGVLISFDSTSLLVYPLPTRSRQFRACRNICMGHERFYRWVRFAESKRLSLDAVTHFSGTTVMIILAFVFHSTFPAKQNLQWAVATRVCLVDSRWQSFIGRCKNGKHGANGTMYRQFWEPASRPYSDSSRKDFRDYIRSPGSSLRALASGSSRGQRDGAAIPRGSAQPWSQGSASRDTFFAFIRPARPRCSGWRACPDLSRCSRPVQLWFSPDNSVRLTGRAWRGDWGAGVLDISGSALFIVASQRGRLDSAVVISSLYPAVTVLLARFFLQEHFSRWRVVGMMAALAAVPMIAG